MGCTKQNGDTAREGYIAVLLASVCCFYVAALFGLAAGLVGVVYDPVERILRLFGCVFCLGRSGLSPPRAAERLPGVYAPR